MTIIATVEFTDGEAPVELRDYDDSEISQGCASWLFMKNGQIKERIIYPLHRIKSIVVAREEP